MNPESAAGKSKERSQAEAPVSRLGSLAVSVRSEWPRRRTSAARGPTRKGNSARHSLSKLRAQAADCRACDLWRHATQTASNQEDRAGKPFVGTAGGLLEKVLDEAGIDRRDVYITNAVKHFKFESRGKQRIRKKPQFSEIAACRPWLLSEIEAVKPEVIVCLGAPAAMSLPGPAARVTRDRGKLMSSDLGAPVMLTLHPASILRAPDPGAREAALHLFRRDIGRISTLLKAKTSGSSG